MKINDENEKKNLTASSNLFILGGIEQVIILFG